MDNNEFWQITADLFQNLFEKPKMTKKLLEKPPFRYILDIIKATMETTSFAKNLFLEAELNPEFYSDTKKKQNFLKKLILYIEISLNTTLDINPSKILAGLECHKTNIMLQNAYKVAVNDCHSMDNVQNIKSKIASGSLGPELVLYDLEAQNFKQY